MLARKFGTGMATRFDANPSVTIGYAESNGAGAGDAALKE
jgi:hypothetical protein